jgi:hypothetical protein
MTRRLGFGLGLGLFLGVCLAGGVAVWWGQGPSEARVQRTVVTTVQEEAPASFLVTGTLTVSASVQIDSAQYATPGWLTYVVEQTQPSLLPLLQGSSAATVKVPGRVSYGFDVRALTPQMIGVEEGGGVRVDLPELAVHSVEPDLSRLRVRTTTEGWMRLFPSGAHEEVRKRALAGVQDAFRTQAERRIETATQPRVHTARALENMLTPPLEAAGIPDPRFRIRIGDRLSLHPDGNED